MTSLLLFVAALAAVTIPVPAGAQCCGDCNGDGIVTIDEVVAAVNHALNGCAQPARPTPTPQPQSGGQLTRGGLTLLGVQDGFGPDTVSEGFADVDLCQDICSIVGDSFPTVTLESFGATSFNMTLSYRGSGTATISAYSVPGINGEPDMVRQVNWRIPGGTCSNNVFGRCGRDADCANEGTCSFNSTLVDVLLYSPAEKQLLVGDQMCPLLDTSTLPFTVTPGNVTPLHGDLAVTFSGNDPMDGNFSFPLHFAATLHDANHCP